MTTVATHDYQIRDLGYGYEVVDAMHGNRTVAGPFVGPEAYEEALRALGSQEGKSLADGLLDAFRKGIGL